MSLVLIKGLSGELMVAPNQSDIQKAYRESLSKKDTQLCERIKCIYDLVVLRDSLELTDGDLDILQLGGLYQDTKRTVKRLRVSLHSHHIPAQSVQNDNKKNLSTVVITGEDHKKTDSFLWKSITRHQSFLSDVSKSQSYKNEAKQMINDGRFAELVEKEVFNIRDQFGNKYDGGIKQYFDAIIEYIGEYGIPKW